MMGALELGQILLDLAFGTEQPGIPISHMCLFVHIAENFGSSECVCIT